MSNFLNTIETYYNSIYNYIFQHQNRNLKFETIFFDFETTGLNPYHCKIIEYAFLLTNNESIHSLINPNEKFDKKITDITGIHPDELEDKPYIEDKLKEIDYFINFTEQNEKKNIYLIAHNCDGFDKIILKRLCKDYNVNHINHKINHKYWKFIDTLLLAKKLLPNLKSYSQKNLALHFKIKPSNHRALDDTKTLKKIYHKLLEICSDKMSVSVEFLIENPQIIYIYLY